jgi:hypothetical protein
MTTAEPPSERSRRDRVGIAWVTAAVVVLGLAGATWWYYRTDAPRVSDATCRWRGNRILVSGTVTNPNHQAISNVWIRPTFTLSDGLPQYRIKLFGIRARTLQPHESARFALSVPTRWHEQPGSAITACSPSAVAPDPGSD